MVGEFILGGFGIGTAERISIHLWGCKKQMTSDQEKNPRRAGAPRCCSSPYSWSSARWQWCSSVRSARSAKVGMTFSVPAISAGGVALALLVNVGYGEFARARRRRLTHDHGDAVVFTAEMTPALKKYLQFDRSRHTSAERVEKTPYFFTAVASSDGISLWNGPASRPIKFWQIDWASILDIRPEVVRLPFKTVHALQSAYGAADGAMQIAPFPDRDSRILGSRECRATRRHAQPTEEGRAHAMMVVESTGYLPYGDSPAANNHLAFRSNSRRASPIEHDGHGGPPTSAHRSAHAYPTLSRRIASVDRLPERLS